MHLLTSLLIVIVAARLLGGLFERFKQPSIVGEMLAGVLLGPSVFGLIQVNASLAAISELAVFLVVLSAGFEMKFKDVADALKGRGLVIALLGFVIPFASGMVLGLVFELDVMRTVFLALCISITALPVAVRILQNFKLLDTDMARFSIAAAVFSDVLALMILGVILNLPDQGSLGDVGFAVFSIAWKLLLLCALIIGLNLFFQRLLDRGIHMEKIPEKLVELLGNEALFGVLILFVLLFASASEVLGFHFVIGAFFGALLIDPKFFLASRYHELQRTLGSVTGGFLAPVFFAYMGLEFNVGAVDSIWFLVAVLLVSMLSKILAGWLGGRLVGLAPAQSRGIGVMLNGRGIMELVIAGIAYERGFIGQGLFTTLILMGVVTTVMTPLLLKKWVLPGLKT